MQKTKLMAEIISYIKLKA